MKFLILAMFMMSTPAFDQIKGNVPPAPVITSSKAAVGSITINANAPQCHSGTACGLSNCGCWIQVWRAQCQSASSCPAIAQGAPYVQPSTLTFPIWQDNATGGTDFQILDTDQALAAGTTWIYFATVNFSVYTPFTPGPPSNSTGALSPGGTQPTVPWSVYIDFDNASCITGKTCGVRVYRAPCSSACPAYPNPAYVQLPSTSSTGKSYVTATVSASKTHFKFQDDGAIPGNLGYAKSYYYAVFNSFDANPSAWSTPAATLAMTTPTGQHQATLNYSNASCTTNAPCTLQVYRATCAPSCPTYPAGTWSALQMAPGLTTTPGATGTSWKYIDNDAALKGATTYVWVATNRFTNGPQVSGPSQPYTGTTTVGRSTGKKEKKR